MTAITTTLIAIITTTIITMTITTTKLLVPFE